MGNRARDHRTHVHVTDPRSRFPQSRLLSRTAE
jgi:hypothetical protein